MKKVTKKKVVVKKPIKKVVPTYKCGGTKK